MVFLEKIRRTARMASLLTVLILPAWWAWSGDGALEAAKGYRERNGARILQEFAHFLSIPNVAQDLPNMHRNAVFIQAAFKKRGVEMELLELPDVPPLVYGELKAEGATRTLLVYVHYDGQPVDPTRWTHDPWSATLYSAAMKDGGKPRPFPRPGEVIDPEWRIYARAAGDDKAPIPAILAALDALQEAGIPRTSNLKFLFEGEEEAGSIHLKKYLELHRDKLAGDFWLFCDGPMHQSRRPQVIFGCRGVTGMELRVFGANRSLHSGHYGNWSPVPGMALAHLLASMKEEDGKVVIEGFYDTVTPIGALERAALAELPEVDDQLRKELGLAWTEADNAPLAQRILLPSLTVSGLESGNVGAKGRNVIPAHATARLGIRMVKGNEPEHMLDLVEAHIKKQGYHIVYEEPDQKTRLRHRKLVWVSRFQNGYPAARTSMDQPIAQQVIAAVERASGETVVRLPTVGGSLPLFLFTDLLQQPAIVLPIANHDDKQHAPDENLRIANLWMGIDIYAAVFAMPE